MKRFEELNVTVLKDFGVKENNEELKTLIYAINDKLYKRQKQYAVYTIASKLYKDLVQYGIQVKNVEVKKDILKKKKEEILQKIRTTCNILHDYMSQYEETEENEDKALQSLQKYQISKYLKNKENLTTEEIIRLLEENMEIVGYITRKNTVLLSFNNMQKELLQKLVKEYTIDLNDKK